MVLWGLREKEGSEGGRAAAQCSSGWAAAVAVVAEVFACSVGWLGVSHSACFTLQSTFSPREVAKAEGRIWNRLTQPHGLNRLGSRVGKERKGSIFEFGHYCQIKTNDAETGRKQQQDGRMPPRADATDQHTE